MAFSRFAVLALAALSCAQHVTVPMTCEAPYMAGTDEVIYTVPYTYQQVMSIIGSYKNLTWSGNPPNTVKLNGTDNTVGTARTYYIDGAEVIETITTYSKPSNGPYDEVHTTATISIPAVDLKVYIPYDGTTVTPICNGMASTFNFTAHYCANNVTTGGAVLHMAHLTDAQTVGVFLGGMNFTSCAALMNGTATASGYSSASSAPAVVTATSGSSAIGHAAGLAAVVLAGAAFVM